MTIVIDFPKNCSERKLLKFFLKKERLDKKKMMYYNRLFEFDLLTIRNFVLNTKFSQNFKRSP